MYRRSTIVFSCNYALSRFLSPARERAFVRRKTIRDEGEGAKRLEGALIMYIIKLCSQEDCC